MKTLSNINEKIGRYRWTICGLIFFATTVNYLDRQVLSLLQPTLEKIYGWNNTDYANITAVFQFVYALSMLLAGRVVDRLGTKGGYAWAIVIWSIGAMIHAGVYFVHPESKILLWGMVVPLSVLGFMVCRTVLAFGEAGNFPAAIKATAEWFPKKERSFATGIFNSGTNVGAILAPLTVPVMSRLWGWEWAFIIVGALGFVWLIFWLIMYDLPEKKRQQGTIGQAEYNYIHSDDETPVAGHEAQPGTNKKISWLKLLTFRQTWMFTIGKFMTDGVWWFFLFWLPGYLNKQYGMINEAVMLPLAVLYSMTMIGSIGGGKFPEYFINKGLIVYKARMRAMLVIAFFPLVVLLAQPLGSISFWIPVLLIGVGASAHQAWSANIFTTVSDLFPKKAIASVTGIGGMAGGMGGVVVSKCGGWIFDHFEKQGHLETGYTIMFSFCAVAYLLAWGIMKLLVPRFAPIKEC